MDTRQCQKETASPQTRRILRVRADDDTKDEGECGGIMPQILAGLTPARTTVRSNSC